MQINKEINVMRGQIAVQQNFLFQFFFFFKKKYFILNPYAYHRTLGNIYFTYINIVSI
jgi:hypothetical protein